MTPRPYHDKDFRHATLWFAKLGPLEGKRGETREVSITIDRDCRAKDVCSSASGNYTPGVQGPYLLSLSVDGVTRVTFRAHRAGNNTRESLPLYLPEGSVLTAKVRFDRACTFVVMISGKALPPQTLEEIIRDGVRKHFNL